MKRDIPTGAGIGFTILIAAATLAVAVVAGIFLVYQSEMTLGFSGPVPSPGPTQMSLAQRSDAGQAQAAPSFSQP
jgi:hypothetical protein